MDLSRIVSATCVLLLTFCLLLTVCAFTTLRLVLKESVSEAQNAAQPSENPTTETPSSNEAEPSTEDLETDVSIPVDVLADRFCMRAENGRVAIYTADGYLIRALDIAVEALPAADQDALRQGINVSSWKEILALLQDFDVG